MKKGDEKGIDLSKKGVEKGAELEPKDMKIQKMLQRKDTIRLKEISPSQIFFSINGSSPLRLESKTHL